MQIVSPTCTYSGHKDFSTDCSFTGPPWIAISTGDDKRVNLWRIGEDETKKETIQILPDVGWKCSITDNGKTAAAACNDGYVRVWRTVDGTLLCSFNCPGFDCSYGVALSSLGNYLVASFFNTETRDGLLVRYILPSRVQLRATVQHSWRVPLGWDHGSVSISKSAEVVAVAGSEGLQMFEGRQGHLMFRSSDLTRNFDISLSSKGRRTVVADKKRLQIFYQTSSGSWRVRYYDGYRSPLSPCCSISGDGKRALAAMYDGSFRLWSISQRNPIVSLQGHLGPGRGCAISYNGSVAMTTSTDLTVRFWELDGSTVILPKRLKIEEKGSVGNNKIEKEREEDLPSENVENNNVLRREEKKDMKKIDRTPNFQSEVEEIRDPIPANRRLEREKRSEFSIIKDSRLVDAVGSLAGDIIKWFQKKSFGESAAPAD